MTNKCKNNYETLTKEEQKAKVDKLEELISKTNEEILLLKNHLMGLCDERDSLIDIMSEDEVKYEVLEEKRILDNLMFIFYVETKGCRRNLVECYVDEREVDEFWLDYIPAKYRGSFSRAWKSAYDEQCKCQQEEEAIYKRMLENERLSNEWDNLLTKKKDEDKAFYKDCYRKLVKVVHPDNTEINMDDKTEAMKCLNQLKKQWNF